MVESGSGWFFEGRIRFLFLSKVGSGFDIFLSKVDSGSSFLFEGRIRINPVGSAKLTKTLPRHQIFPHTRTRQSTSPGSSGERIRSYQRQTATKHSLVHGSKNIKTTVIINYIILVCNSEIVAHVRSYLCYLICLRHWLRSRTVTKRIFFFSEMTFVPLCVRNML